MSELVRNFRSELVAVVRGSERPSLFYRGRLLRQAAVIITLLREQIEDQTMLSSRDWANDLNNMADAVDLHIWPDVEAMLVEAVRQIDTLEVELKQVLGGSPEVAEINDGDVT